MTKFCTAINCMDGRIQIPVIKYLREKFDVEFVDIISEAGPNGILAKQENPALIESILNRLKISIENHKSVGIAVVGHYGCFGNPADQKEQSNHTKKAIQFIRNYSGNLNIIGLWVDENSKVLELD